MSSTLPDHVRQAVGKGGPSRGQLYDLLIYHLVDRQWDGYPEFQFEPQSPPQDPTNILIIVLSSIGDVTTVLPTIHSMARKWPSADLDFLCERECDTAVAGHPDLTNCHRIPLSGWVDWLENDQGEQARQALRDVLNDLRRRSFDYVVNLHWTPFASLVTRFLNPPNVNGLFIDDSLRPVIRGNPLRYLKYRKMVEDESAPIPLNSASYKRLSADVARGETRFYARRDDSEYGDTSELFDREANDELPHVLINTGSRMEPRQWPAEHCAESLEIIGRDMEVEFGLIGGPGDEERLKTVESLLSDHISVVPWYRMTESLMEDVYLSDHCDLTISTDSGPLHLMSIRGNPVLDIAGDMWVGPWNRDSLVVRETSGDISLLEPERVAEGLRYLLGEGPLPGPDDRADWFGSSWSAESFWFRHFPLHSMSDGEYVSWLSGMVSLTLWLEEAQELGWDGLNIGGDTVREIINRIPFDQPGFSGRSSLNITGGRHLNGNVEKRVGSILSEWGI